ncbi:MAG: hypothetical protein JSS34_05305 [Proteobacteria bacterium]|nr:hypothetical protein [Pseudomonadota bacterium]
MEKKEDHIELHVQKMSPLTQEHLLGHESVEKNLRRLIDENKLPHALLITGPSGIGKATLGFRLSRFLCIYGIKEEQEKIEPDSLYVASTHPLFRRFVQHSFGDFLCVPEEGNTSEIGIDAIRNLIHFLHQTPREGTIRCVLIEDAHLMNRNAANALLKILEAPPSHVFLILVTSKENLMLPTILSRVHKIRLSPLDSTKTREILHRNLETASEEEVNFLEEFSEGSPGFGENVFLLGGKAFYNQLCAFFEGCVLRSKEQHLPFDLIHTFLEKHKNEHLSCDFIYGFILKSLSIFLDLHRKKSFFQKEIDFSMSYEARLALWSRAQHILMEALTFDLDLKQVLSSLFLEIYEAFSA